MKTFPHYVTATISAITNSGSTWSTQVFVKAEDVLENALNILGRRASEEGGLLFAAVTFEKVQQTYNQSQLTGLAHTYTKTRQKEAARLLSEKLAAQMNDDDDLVCKSTSALYR